MYLRMKWVVAWPVTLVIWLNAITFGVVFKRIILQCSVWSTANCWHNPGTYCGADRTDVLVAFVSTWARSLDKMCSRIQLFHWLPRQCTKFKFRVSSLFFPLPFPLALLLWLTVQIPRITYFVFAFRLKH